MFLRATKRKKDGKIHHYWSVVENVRVGRRVFQRRALYLGELNDSQHAEWQRAIEAIDENGRITQLKLFPEERAPESDDGGIVRIQMNRLSVRNMRNWGEVWLGLQLWDNWVVDWRDQSRHLVFQTRISTQNIVVGAFNQLPSLGYAGTG